MCATSTPSSCGRRSAWCPSGVTCSPAPSPTTCATEGRGDRRGCATRCGWRGPTTSSAHPDGLEPVAQAGNVSGGQRQRLAIARAVIRRPAIYLFDDAFSALDVHTDARVRAALRRVSADSTVVIVSQRISTVAEADHVVVVDDSQVVGAETHENCWPRGHLRGSSPTPKRLGAGWRPRRDAGRWHAGSAAAGKCRRCGPRFQGLRAPAAQTPHPAARR